MTEFNKTYTAAELQYFESEMHKYRLPWISKVLKKYGMSFIKYSFLPAIIVITIFGILYSNSASGQNDWMWSLDKAIGLFYIIGFGFFALISHLAELISANKLRRRLGLSRNDFKIMITQFQITGI